MAQNKSQLIRRIKKIRGQLNSIESSIQSDRNIKITLQYLAACHGALAGLMWIVAEDYFKSSAVSLKDKSTLEQKAWIEDMARIIKSFLR